MSGLNSKTTLLIVLGSMLLLAALSGCDKEPEPILQSTPIPPGVEVLNITEGETVTNEITQKKTFNQCDSASPFKAQIQFSQSSSQEVQRELVLGATVGGEAGVSEIAKIKLEGTIEQHFASSKTIGQGHEEGVEIEVPPRTQQEYTIVWRESRRKGDVQYLEDGETKIASYSYRIGLELVSTTGKDLICPGQDTQQAHAVPTPAPTSTPRPTPAPTSTPQPTPLPAATATPPPPTEQPITQRDAVLEVGEWWRADGVWLRVREVELDKYGCISIYLELWNKTAGSLIFQWSAPASFTLEDNTGHIYQLDTRFKGDSEVIEAGEVVKLRSSPFGPAAYYEDKYYFGASVTDMYFTVVELSRISYAKWHIQIPK